MTELELFKKCFELRAFQPELPPELRQRIKLRTIPPPASSTPQTAMPPPGEAWDASRLEFDPALKHFMNGWRSGEPELEAVQRNRWRRAHGTFMTHVLEQVAGSELSEQLVLRGSSAMPFWVGEEAREPKDIDFVVRPDNVDIHSAAAHELRRTLRELVEQTSPGGITVLPEATALSDIWTYDRVPGQRFVFTWRANDLPWAQTQIDLVFCERLPQPPRRLPNVDLLVASPELCLAWKILWLYTDMHPQAKDLYDAMVLAERHPLPVDLLREVFRDVFRDERGSIQLSRMVNTELEWVGLEPRSPWDEASQELAKSWWQRLVTAAPRLADPTPL